MSALSNPVFRLGVLISGGGRTLVNLYDRIADGSLPARIDVVVSTRSDAPGVIRARERHLPVTIIDPREYRNADGGADVAFHGDVYEAVKAVDLVCMAGCLSLWRFPDSLAGRVINIHPALLPEFGGRGMFGLRVHEAVLAAGKTVSGCTVHICDNEYDHGPILLQRKVPVHPNDTPESLAQRVFEQECMAYPEAVQLFADGRVHFSGGQVETLAG